MKSNTFLKYTFLSFIFSTWIYSFGISQMSVTSATSEIFKTNFFLKNSGDLIPDYKGQQIRYFADHEGTGFFFADEGLIYKLKSIDNHEDRDEHETMEETSLAKVSYTFVQWIGANPHPQITGSGKGPGYYTFLAGSADKDLHTLTAEGFAKITYIDLYPGIDVEYSFPDKGGIKYNLLVHPGADLNSVKMKYSGSVKKLSKDRNGNIVIKTAAGEIIENAPVSFTADNHIVPSVYSIQGKTISFKTPDGFDRTQTLIVDPWVQVLTTLTTHEFGSYADYDSAGNLFVYGAGSSSIYDSSTYQKVVMYNTSGVLQWTFMGVVSGVWSSNGYGVGTSFNNCLSSAKVDKATGKIYVGQGFALSGARAIRLTPAGLYDNFITTPDTTFKEIWSFTTNCATGEVLALGGGPVPNTSSIGIINTSTGTIGINNITGVYNYNAQDISSATVDPSGNLYVIIASVPGNSTIHNHLYQVNAARNGHVWTVFSGHNTLIEHISMPAFAHFGSSSNFNSLASNSTYLFYYDGKYLMAFNPANGSAVGATYVIPGYDTLMQGGIAVDNCNNVYCGGKGVIKTFNFNGTNFVPQTDISLGPGFTSDSIFDVRYNPANNLLYVTGTRIAGTYNATLSTTCVVASGSFTTAVTDTCTRAIAMVTSTTGLSNPVFSYTWLDSAGTVVRQTPPGSFQADTLPNPGPGRYTVEVILNQTCSDIIQTDSFTISTCANVTILIHSNDTTICSGQPVMLSASGSPTGGSYVWLPGGAVTQSITVNPGSSTTYYITYTPLAGGPVTDSIRVNVTTAATVSVNDSTICRGSNATLIALPSVGGGTYLWSPGSATTQSITVSPFSTSTFTVTYSSGLCGVAVDSGTVSVIQPPVLSVTSNDTAICAGQSVILSASSSLAGGTYLWTPGNFNTQSILVSPVNSTVYSVSYASICPTVTAKDSVNVTLLPAISVSDTTICYGASAVLTASVSQPGGTFIWTPGGATTQTITVSPSGSSSYTIAYSSASCSSNPVLDTALVTVRPQLQAIIHADTTTICSNDSGIICTDSSYVFYNWNAGGATQCIHASLAGNYYVTVTDAFGCSAESNHLSITVHPVPPTSISVNGDTLTAYNGSTYQWYLNSSPISEATSSFIIATMPGSYSVSIGDTNGCVSSSSPIIFSAVENVSADKFEVYPNPSGYQGWSLSVNESMIGLWFELFDDAGKLVYKSQIQSSVSQIGNNLASGVYLLKINSGTQFYVQKLVKLN